MAVARAWTGCIRLSSLQQKQQPLAALGIGRHCCSCHTSVSQPVGLSSSFSAGWTLTTSNRTSGSRKEDAARFTVLASQEAGTSTLLVQEVEFIWKGQGSEILLTGDFLKWETKLRLRKGSNGSFSVKEKLPVGKFAYKFIVDGEWMHSADSPTVPDGTGGFNNEVIVTDPRAKVETKDTLETPKSQPTISSKTPPSVAAGDAAKESEAGKPNADAAAVKPAAKAPPKKVVKSLQAAMLEDVIPQLLGVLEMEEGLSELDITFDENQLKTSFTKRDIPYCHWAFFPDGTLEGARGAALTSHGSPPSTIEPFLVDENRITPELVVFWIRKRLFAQKILSVN